MKSDLIAPADFPRLIREQTPVIDVRAPVEFAQGTIPGAVNLPLMSNEERHEIGIIYKERGQEAAIQRGHELVSGATKTGRIEAWRDFAEKNPRATITCFRGGLRSRISQQWLAEAGFPRPRIQGGYKTFRKFLLNELSRLSRRPLCVVSGATGSGKTRVIRDSKKFRPTLDLEALASHRGSAFGALDQTQPAQADFENLLAAELIRLETSADQRALVLEDESRMIGKIVQPEPLFHSLRSSPILLIEEPLPARVQTIFEEYISEPLQHTQPATVGRKYSAALKAIAPKLGDLRHRELQSDLAYAIATGPENHKVWIEKLLEWYYDPFYFNSLKKRAPVIAFRGTQAEVLAYIKHDS